MTDVVLELPASLRGDLKAPLGPIYTDAERLLADATDPVVAVGDIVTYHLLEAGHVPAVAFVDERTKRDDVDDEVRAVIGGRRGSATPASADDRGEADGGFDAEVEVANPPGAITRGLLAALRDGLEADAATLVRVDGEEDLAALPAVLAVPDGASVVYGQPDEGMVLVTADAESRGTARDLLEGMDGDALAAFELIGV